MRFPRPRFAVRRLMVAVAVVIGTTVVALKGCAILNRRASEYDTAADRYHEYADAYDPPANAKGIIYSSCYGEQWDRYTDRVAADRRAHFSDKAYLRSKADHYRRLSRTYSQAARRPWFPVSPDPPEPK